jgi:fibronectin-binding autotransporter adhesin
MQKVSLGNCRHSTKRIANFRQRRISIAAALALMPISGLISSSARGADSASDLNTATTTLDQSGAYTPSGLPGTGNDLVITNSTYTSTALTSGTNAQITPGTLDDLNTTQTFTLTLSGTAPAITLSTLSNGVSGSNNDLLYIASGGKLTIAGTGGLAVGVTGGNFDIVGAGTISSNISDGGNAYSITKTGAGSLYLSGSNSFTGGLTVSAGSVSLGSVNALASTSAVTLGSASGVSELYDTNGSQATFATLSLVDNTTNALLYTNSGSITVTGAVSLGGADVSNLTVDNNNSNGGNLITLAGAISGKGTITIDNSFGGTTVLSNTSINNAGGIVNAGTGTGAGTISGNIGSNVTNVIENSTTGSNLYLSGTNAATGPVFTSTAGVLEFQKEVSLFNDTTANWTTSNIIAQPGATVAFEVGNAGGFTSADLATLNALGTSSGGFENGSFLGIDTTGASLNPYTGNGGVITNSNGGANAVGLNKLGTNSLILNANQTYTGATIITAGNLQLGINSPTANANLASPSILDNGGLVFGPGTGTTEAYTGNIGGTGTVQVNGAGSVSLSGIGVYTGTTTITAGSLDLKNSLAVENSTVTPASATDLVFDSSVASNAFTVGGLTGANNLTLQNNAGTPAAITLTVGGLSNISTTYSGNLLNSTGTGSSALTVFGFSNTFTLESAASTYTGTTTINGGTLNLGGATANGSINSSSPLVLGGLAGGGVLAYTRTGTVAQTFNGTTITQGENFITTSTAAQTLNLGSLTGLPGGTVDINPFSGSTITITDGNTNGILGGFATYGGKTTWAVAPATSGGAIAGLASGSYTESGTALTTASNYTNANIDVNASETLAGPITPNSVRFNSSTAYTLTLTGLNTITSGGILNTPTATNGGTITGGLLTGSPSGQLAVSTAGGVVTLGSTIIDNGGPTALVISGTNSTTELALSNAANLANSFSGGFYLNGSGVRTDGGGTIFGTGAVYFGNSNVYTGSAGGAIVFGTTTYTVTSGLLSAASGNNTSNGDISGNSGGIWTLMGQPGQMQTFAGIVGSYSGGRVANFAVDGGTEIIGNTQVGMSAVIANGGTYQVGTGYWGSISNANNNVSLTTGGGTFTEFGNYAGMTNQPFKGGLVLAAGASTISAINNSGAGVVVGFTAAGSRAVGSTADFVLPNGPQSLFNGFTTVNLNTNGILGGYLTVGGTDWATNATNLSGGNIIGLSASSINSYSTDTFGTGLNTDVTTSDAFPASTSTNSIRFNAANSNTVTLGGTGTITSGGILVTPNVGANAGTITGGTVEGSASGDLIVIQNNTSAGLTIASTIANNGGATGLTKSGSGLLTLTGTNTFTGGLFLNGGVLNTTSSGIAGIGSVVFNGGTLQSASAITTAKAVAIGVNGGTVDTTGGNVTVSGNMTNSAINAQGGDFIGAGAFGGFVNTNVGLVTVTGGNTLSLSGTANAFGGGLLINNGTVQNAATNALGTGYVTFANNGNTASVDLDGHNAQVAGLIGSGSNGAVTNSTATASTLTFNGVYSEAYNGAIQAGSGAINLAVVLNNPTEAVTFGGANTYTGTTSVTSGQLYVNGSHTGGGAYTIGGGTLSALLGGTGSIGSSVTAGTFATIRPGTTATPLGTLSLTGNVQMNDPSTFIATVNSDTVSSSSLLSVTGTVAVGSSAGATLSVVDLGANVSFTPNSVYTIISATSAVTNTFANLSNGSTVAANNGSTYLVEYNYNSGYNVDLVSQTAPTPEPGSLSLLGVAAMGFLGRRRRRASKKAI